MEDPLKKRVEALRAYSESVKRRSSLYSNLSKIDDKKTASSLGALQRAPCPGGKLKKIGFIMLWVPEPTGVTCAIGGPMILAGKYLDKKYNGATIANIGTQAKDTHSSISDFKNSLS